jgi:hypothetical protein
MDFLERENMLDDIGAQIEKSNLKLGILKGGEKKTNSQMVNQVQSLIKYLKNSNGKDNNTRHINFQIGQLNKKYLS